jgi:hypothetical protein
MLFGAVGDVHGDFDALSRAMVSRPDISLWISVGDLAGERGAYPRLPSHLYFIKGNNEDFGFIERNCAPQGGRNVSPWPCGGDAHGLFFLPNGVRAVLQGVGFAALGGTFAPTWYGTPAADLPFPGSSRSARPVRDDKRRHFVREEVEACVAMGHADVLLTHEAPRPFIVQAGNRRLDAGKQAINEVLRSLQPRLHLFGHHHRWSESVREGVRSVGLDLVGRSFLVVDAGDFSYSIVANDRQGSTVPESRIHNPQSRR